MKQHHKCECCKENWKPYPVDYAEELIKKWETALNTDFGSDPSIARTQAIILENHSRHQQMLSEQKTNSVLKEYVAPPFLPRFRPDLHGVFMDNEETTKEEKQILKRAINKIKKIFH